MSEWISVEDRLPEKQSWNHIAILDTKTGRISVEQDLYAIETATIKVSSMPLNVTALPVITVLKTSTQKITTHIPSTR